MKKKFKNNNKLKYENDICTGKLLGNDCNGLEKVRKIKEIYNLSKYEKIYAYGDTDGDKPMLDIADIAFYRKF